MKIILSLLMSVTVILFSPSSMANSLLIIDAGSSGSRIYLYDNQQSSIRAYPIDNDKTKPGLSSFVNHPEQAGASLQVLFNAAKQTIKKYHLNDDSDLAILATAGMRILSEQQQSVIYAEIADYVKNNTQFHLIQARTISGQEEAIYAWVAANSLAGYFDNQQATHGIIELGGASLQVAYAVHADESASTSVTIHGNEYRLFAKSFLYFGQDEVAKQLDNPEACLPNGFIDQNGKIGRFDMNTCQDKINNFFNLHHSDELFLPNDYPFWALSAFYYTQNFFTPKNSISLTKTISGGICQQNWTSLIDMYPSENKSYLSGYCRNGVYISQLLSEFLHVKQNSNQIIPVEKINNQPVSWTLGVAESQIAADTNSILKN